MPAERDVAAFEERAMRYEEGWLGGLHHEIAERTADVALRYHPVPTAILDVGCGTGYLLGVLASRCPDTAELVGIDPARSMVDAARRSTRDPRIVVAEGSAERIPSSDGAFDLVVSTTSFDHWADQAAGICECARVLAPRGHLVLADLFSRWLAPTLIGSRRSKARTRRRAGAVLNGAGLHVLGWHGVYPLIRAVVAARPEYRSAVDISQASSAAPLLSLGNAVLADVRSGPPPCADLARVGGLVLAAQPGGRAAPRKPRKARLWWLPSRCSPSNKSRTRPNA
jgi:ubiquinone/menaquinone biosynthesis C-methylase UbiE